MEKLRITEKIAGLPVTDIASVVKEINRHRMVMESIRRTKKQSSEYMNRYMARRRLANGCLDVPKSRFTP